MADGFDISELDSFVKDITETINDYMPKESKKFIKKEATSLNKVNKQVYKSKGIGIDQDDTPADKKIINRFKAGKAYKFNGTWSSRAYNSSPHAHLVNDGFIHTPHKGQAGEEKFIPGYHFMEDAEKQFEAKYFEDCGTFVDGVIDNLGK